ncbi:MAG: hypothetical protein AAB339_01735 [Elusimicrobiota bacterium]
MFDKNGYQVLLCPSCDTAFIDPMPGEEAIRGTYTLDYFKGNRSKFGYADYSAESAFLAALASTAPIAAMCHTQKAMIKICFMPSVVDEECIRNSYFFVGINNTISRPTNWAIQIAQASALAPVPPMSQMARRVIRGSAATLPIRFLACDSEAAK